MIQMSLISDFCKKKGISLTKLATDLEMSPTGLSGILANNSTTLASLEKISHYFGVSVGVFFGEEDKDVYLNVFESLNNLRKRLEIAEADNKRLQEALLEKSKEHLVQLYEQTKKENNFLEKICSKKWFKCPYQPEWQGSDAPCFDKIWCKNQLTKVEKGKTFPKIEIYSAI